MNVYVIKDFEKSLTINKADIHSIKFTYPNLLNKLESTLNYIMNFKIINYLNL